MGLCPELPRLPGGHLQLTATIHAPLQPSPDEHHSLPASFLDPAQGRGQILQVLLRDVAASYDGVTGNCQQPERRDNREKV